MSGTKFQSAWLSDPRLSAHALSPMPAWLWRTDRPGILWSNPVGAAIFDAASPGVLAASEFEPDHVSVAQIARLAGTLPQGGAPRLERLRGFGARFGSPLTCLCSRITLDDNSTAILVVSTERAGKDLSLPDRVRRILADFDKPAAVFSADGELIEATASAKETLGTNRDVMAIGAERLASEASKNGKAEGDIASGRVTMLRLGAWIEAAQAQGTLNPKLPPIAVLYTLYARACDPVLEFLKMGGQHDDAQIIDLVMSTCFDGLNARPA